MRHPAGSVLQGGVPPGMKAVSKSSGRILDALTRNLELGEARKVDNAPGAYMAVHVDHVEDTALGPAFAVAHYYEQGGDLIPDPDVVFLRALDGRWYPLAFQNSLGYRRAAEVRADGEVMVHPARQRDLASFSNMWVRNIREQQGLGGRS